jgi:hypothetical protein
MLTHDSVIQLVILALLPLLSKLLKVRYFFVSKSIKTVKLTKSMKKAAFIGKNIARILHVLTGPG